jgi:hypothetical protein
LTRNPGLFSANLDTDALNALRADPDVESLGEDAIMQAWIVTQTDAVQLITTLLSAFN